MNALEVLQKQKIIQRHIVNADANGDMPTRIEILRAGTWPSSSVKGPLEITVSDLTEMKANFDAGIGVPGGKQTGLPIDFMHEDWDKAAAWIKELEVEGSTLFAIVEWSKAGEEAVRNKEFKCVSPSFYPACLGQWKDPENADVTARNVLVGAGLTNIPFFKDLKPIMASRNSSASGDSEDNIIFIASEKEEHMPTLDEVRVKDASALNEDEKNMLVEANSKGELTAEEQTKFGFEVTNKEGDKKVEASNKIDADTKAKIEADAVEAYKKTIEQDGKVVVEVSALESLKASQTKFETQVAEQFVKAQIGRGAIKADTEKTWVERLVNASAEDRELFEDTLKALPDNPAMAGKQGEEAGVEASAADLVSKKAEELIKASNGTLDIASATLRVLKENPDLAEKADAEAIN